MNKKTLLWILAALVIIPLAYAFVWPASFGGRASYAIVSGISMEPGYQTGDLVVVRQVDDYEVGDVVLFATPDGDVVHRIVGGDAETGFITQGDNKTEVDPWQPTPASIRGREWLHVPNVGGWIYNTRAIVPLPILGGAVAAALYGGKRRRRRRRSAVRNDESRPKEVGVQAMPRRRWSPRHITAAVAATVSGVAFLAFAWMGWTALRADTTDDVVTDAGSVTHQVAFSYTALADGPSVVYPDGRVGPVTPPPATLDSAGEAPTSEAPQDSEEDVESVDPLLVPTPQPLFRELIETVNLVVDYSYTSDAETELAGTYRVDVEVATSDGWSSELGTIIEETPFEGAVQIDVPVEFDEAGARVMEVAAVTGIIPPSFDLIVTPTISIEGTAGERAVERTIAEPFVIGVTEFLIQPDESLLRTVEDPAVVTTAEVARMDVLGFDPTVSDARTIALVGLIASAGLIALALWIGWGRSGPDRIRFLYGSRVVDLGAAPEPAGRVVRMASFNELRRLAVRDDRSILHHQLPGGIHRYLLPDGDTTYVFEISPPERAVARRPAQPLALTAAADPTAQRDGDDATVNPTDDPVENSAGYVAPDVGHVENGKAGTPSRDMHADSEDDLDELLKQIGVEVVEET